MIVRLLKDVMISGMDGDTSAHIPAGTVCEATPHEEGSFYETIMLHAGILRIAATNYNESALGGKQNDKEFEVIAND